MIICKSLTKFHRNENWTRNYCFRNALRHGAFRHAPEVHDASPELLAGAGGGAVHLVDDILILSVILMLNEVI